MWAAGMWSISGRSSGSAKTDKEYTGTYVHKKVKDGSIVLIFLCTFLNISIGSKILFCIGWTVSFTAGGGKDNEYTG